MTDSAGGDGHQNAPAYQSAWDEQFRTENYSPGALRFLSLLWALYCGVTSGKALMEETRMDAWGGADWAFQAWAPRLVGKPPSDIPSGSSNLSISNPCAAASCMWPYVFFLGQAGLCH